MRPCLSGLFQPKGWEQVLLAEGVAGRSPRPARSLPEYTALFPEGLRAGESGLRRRLASVLWRQIGREESARNSPRVSAGMSTVSLIV